AAGQVKNWVYHMLRGLKEMHQHHGRCHRDIKPGNLLFELIDRNYAQPSDLLGDETLVVADFGVIAELGKKIPFALGQDGYKSPELFDHGIPKRNVEAQAAHDLYGVRNVLQELSAVVQGSGVWLTDLAERCLHESVDSLIEALNSYDWEAQTQLYLP